jgi:hypothetical protein
VVGLGLPLAVLSPVFSGADDSFPLSTYPMFSHPRGQPTLYAVVATTPDGREQRLAPDLVGSKEVLQTKVLIQRAVEGGRATMAELCRDTAARVAAAAVPSEALGVAIVRRQYDPILYFVRGPTPIAEETLFRCPVSKANLPDAPAVR